MNAFEAFFQFLIDIFAALAEFLGSEATADEIRQIINNLLGGATQGDANQGE